MSQIKEIKLPDIGDLDQADIIEVLVNVGDIISQEDSLITLEGDKASMEVPSPFSGEIKKVHIKVGDKIRTNQLIASIETKENAIEQKENPTLECSSQEKSDQVEQSDQSQKTNIISQKMLSSDMVHASPIVRKLAREQGIDLSQIQGSQVGGRICLDDLENSQSSTHAVPQIPLPDFSKFGEIKRQKINRIQVLSGKHLQTCWQIIPHVTQFDQADITSLENFRKSMKDEANQQGVRLTLLAFIIKACIDALKKFPQFNASFDAKNNEIILKSYFHIGFAVDTSQGLVVPVIRDVDKKSVYEIAKSLTHLSQKARDGKLIPSDMQGGCFSISSLGGIGGTQFAPVVNGPEVAILGISKALKQPVYDTKTQSFEPRLMLPLALSYDHRIIDGAEGARFISYLTNILSDIRRILL